MDQSVRRYGARFAGRTAVVDGGRSVVKGPA
jgi:hypothetical protein